MLLIVFALALSPCTPSLSLQIISNFTLREEFSAVEVSLSSHLSVWLWPVLLLSQEVQEGLEVRAVIPQQREGQGSGLQCQDSAVVASLSTSEDN